MKNIRLFWQIFPAILITTIISLTAVVWYISTTGRDFYQEQLQEGLKNRALLIESPIVRYAATSPEQLHTFIRTAGRRAATRITLIDKDGLVLSDSNEDYNRMDNHANRAEIQQAQQGGTGASIRFSKTLGHSMLYTAIRIQLQGGEPATLRLAVPTTSYEKKLTSIYTKIGLIGIGIFLIAALFGLFSARRISRPLEKMKKGAEQLTKGRIDQLIKISSDQMSVEMAGLAGALNQMADEINRRVRVIIQQRNELEAVFASMADSVVAIDAKQRILRMNKAATGLFALSSEAVKGEPIHGVIRNHELLGLIEQALQENVTIKEEVTLFSGTQPLILQVHVVPLCDEQHPLGVLLVMHDLTKLNRLENIRQDFVANVSHELKTPITAIKGYVETLLDGALENHEDAVNFLTIVAKQTNKLNSIVDDLLALSRIENKQESGEMELTPQPIAPVFEAAIQTCSSHAHEKNMTVIVEDNEALVIPMNRPLLEQAIINLLQNALAYSPAQSTVTLKAASSQTMTGGQMINLSVIDQGPGIAKEHLPRLFERFYRCDKARGRDVGGTGLGLAIVKHIAHTHNGRVDVISSPDKGSTFTLTIPVNAAKLN